MNSKVTITLALALLAGCASGPPSVPYPAFIAVDELPDTFIAGLPGVRAKQLAGDFQTRRSGSRIQIPPDWEFSSGASPSLSVEIYVLVGHLYLGEYELGPGGYAYIPSGTTGLPLRSDSGASILYFLDFANEKASIQTPLITNSNLLDWEISFAESASDGYSIKELRADPGSGARTWLLRIDPGATRGWLQSSQTLEGYLLSGSIVDSECVAGEAATHTYLPGGYFKRPAGAIHGGPEAVALTGATWFLREPAHREVRAVSECVGQPE